MHEPLLRTPPKGSTRRRFVLRAALTALIAQPLLWVRAFARKAGNVQQKVSAGEPPDTRAIVLHVNGVARTVEVEPRVTLLDALRDRVGLTGTKKGCDQGTCGACTVMVNGQRIDSCLTLAVMQAVYHATGVRVRELPIVPEKLLV